MGRTYSAGGIRRVKTLLLCLTVGLWGCLSPAGTCHSGVSNNRAFSELLSVGQGPAGGACAGPVSLCVSCVQACMLRWGEWVVDRVAMAPSQAITRFVPVLPIAKSSDSLISCHSGLLGIFLPSLPSYPYWPQRSPFSVPTPLFNTILFM